MSTPYKLPRSAEDSLYTSIVHRSKYGRTWGRRIQIPTESFLSLFHNRFDHTYQFIHTDGEVCTPSYSDYANTMNNGNLMAIGDEAGRITLLKTDKRYNVMDAGEPLVFYAHRRAVSDVKWCKDDTILLTAALDGTVRLWDVNNHSILAELEGHTDAIKSVNWHPTNSNLLVTASKDGSFSIWDLRANRRVTEENCDVPSYRPIKNVPEAHNLKGPAKRGRKQAIEPLLIRSVTSAIYAGSDEHKVITSGTLDGTIKLWDTRSSRKSDILQSTVFESKAGKRYGITDLKIDHAGTRLFSTLMDNSVYMHYLIDLDKAAVQFKDPQYKIGSFDIRLAISPNDMYVASGSSNGDIFVWDIDYPTSPCQIFKKHTAKVTGVSWNKRDVDQVICKLFRRLHHAYLE
ncbi:WD40-repeat-containing domain protein [Pilobolus umbonatus]|nr:WD40-repeat-containing domain protein [Pilobolus umbonatus]